jgi:hypothetical protein
VTAFFIFGVYFIGVTRMYAAKGIENSNVHGT